MKEILKTCEVYRLTSNLFVFPVIRTGYGGVTGAAATKFSCDVSATDLGRTIMETIARLSGGFEEVDLRTARNPFLDYLKTNGFKTWASFSKNAIYVVVQFDGFQFEVIPHQKDGRGAFLGLTPIVLLPDPSYEYLGLQVQDALSKVGQRLFGGAATSA